MVVAVNMISWEDGPLATNAGTDNGKTVEQAN